MYNRFVMNNKMTSTERHAVISLSLIMALRMIGLFMIMPVFALYAQGLPHATPFLIGLALGIYGLTQALLQIPFGVLSDHLGRRPIIALGLIFFAGGSLLAAFSHSIYTVIIGRALQGSGAIGSALMALLADLTQEEQRTTAMAIAGMTIGISFALAMIIGPLLTQWLPFQSLFGVAFVFSLLAIFILYTYTPKPRQLAWHPETEPELKLFWTVLKNKELLRLNSGIFFLHALLTASFIALPLSLHQFLGWQGSRQWMLYVPTLLLAFVFSFACIGQAEKKKQVKYYFLGAILGLASAETVLWLFPKQLVVTIIGLILFFSSFSLLEAFLPSLISRTAPPRRKGTALGLYSCMQFLGIFMGGLLGGILYQHFGLLAIYQFCLTLSLLWLSIAYKMASPRYLMTHILKLTRNSDKQGALPSWEELTRQLQQIPGIADITIIAEEQMAYLKIEKKALTHPDFLRIEKLLQHPPKQ